MNCGKLGANLWRFGAAILITIVLALGSKWVFGEPWNFFQVMVTYMLNAIGLAVWAIGEELTNRLKQVGAYLEEDEDFDDTSI